MGMYVMGCQQEIALSYHPANNLHSKMAAVCMDNIFVLLGQSPLALQVWYGDGCVKV